jgi:3-hydroxyacyl-CoA dehydrogenase
MDEGMAMLLDGAKIKEVDNALTKWGFPVGPMTLIDEVGIDVANNVAKFLATDLGDRVGTADPKLLDAVLAKGWYGRKSGTGLHIFPKKVGCY